MTRNMTVDRSPSIRSDVEQAAKKESLTEHSEFQNQYRGMSPEDAEFLANLSAAEKKKAVRKVDVRSQLSGLCLRGR